MLRCYARAEAGKSASGRASMRAVTSPAAPRAAASGPRAEMAIRGGAALVMGMPSSSARWNEGRSQGARTA